MIFNYLVSFFVLNNILLDKEFDGEFFYMGFSWGFNVSEVGDIFMEIWIVFGDEGILGMKSKL